MPVVKLIPIPGDYATAQLPADAAIPAWADGEGFVSISRTPDELSIVCRSDRVPKPVRADRDWSLLKFSGPFDFAQTGIAAAVLEPLAAAKIGVFLVSTYDTDYLLVKLSNFEATLAALRAAGHEV